jgi:hypothetical protein
METRRRSNAVVTVTVDDKGRLTFDVLGAGKVTFDPQRVHEELRAYAELYGWKQRLSDAAAMSRDTDTGKPTSPADKLAAIQELAEYYMSGASKWSRIGTGGGGGKSLTTEAIARVKGIDYAAAEAMVAAFAKAEYGGDTRKALAFLRTGQRVAEAVAAIRAERAPAAKVDADSALTELGAEDPGSFDGPDDE